MRFCNVFLLCVLLAGCGYFKKGPDEQDPDPELQSEVDTGLDLYYELLAEATQVRNHRNGWLDADGCDGWIWAARYDASPGVTGVDMLASERDGKPGSFNRNALTLCWDGEDQGAKSTWSRCMGKAGLILWAWQTKTLPPLERHAKYGKDNNWVMGEPLADGRVVYSPQLIGLLYQTIYALGGENSINRLWPEAYPSGLTDFHAHMQIVGIWLRGAIAHVLESLEDIPKAPPEGAEIALNQNMEEGYYLASGNFKVLHISEVMYSRLQEHANREPTNPFFQYVLGVYTGDMSPALDLLLSADKPVGEYVRCPSGQCVLAERIFVLGLVLRRLGAI